MSTAMGFFFKCFKLRAQLSFTIWNTVTFEPIMQCTSLYTFWKGNEPENPYMTSIIYFLITIFGENCKKLLF